MMKTIYIKSLLTVGVIMILHNTTALTQVSGYMGKRVLGQYNIQVSPAVLNPSFYSYDIDYFPVGLNMNHLFQLEYVVTNKLSIDINFSLFKTRTEASRYITGYYFDDIYTQDYISTSGSVDIIGEVRGKGMGAGFKYYYKNIAPLGAYTGLTVLFMPYKFTFSEPADINDDGNNFQIFNDEDGYFTYAMKFDFGKQRIYFDRMLTNFGLSFGWVFKTLNLDPTGETNSNEVVYQTCNRRMLGMMFFNLNLGIGLLAF